MGAFSRRTAIEPAVPVLQGAPYIRVTIAGGSDGVVAAKKGLP